MRNFRKLCYTFILFALFSILNLNASAQKSPEKAAKKLGTNPMFFIDSIRVQKSDLANQDSEQVTLVIMFYDKEAIEKFGPEAQDGVVFVETKTYAKNKFINYFRKKSAAFDSLFVKNNGDLNFAYIINDKVQSGNFEGNLRSIDDSIFEKITIINKTQLEEQFKITNKDYGIIIQSKKPKDLYNKNKKF